MVFPSVFPGTAWTSPNGPGPMACPGLDSRVTFAAKTWWKSWGNHGEIAGKWLENDGLIVWIYIYIYTHRIQSYLLRKWDWGIIYTIIWRVFCTFSDSVWIHRDGKLLGGCWEIMDMDIDGTLMGHLGLGNWLEMMDIYRIFKGMSALKP